MTKATPTPINDTRGNDARALVLTLTGRDAAMVTALLTRVGVTNRACVDVSELCAELDCGEGIAVIAEEVLASDGLRCLLDALERQPAWSEVPLIVLTAPGRTSRGSTRLGEALERLGNVTHLERPVRLLTLISTVRTALRSRRRQYEIRDLLAAKEHAILDYQSGVRQRDEFLAMLGHELRNPLAPSPARCSCSASSAGRATLSPSSGRCWSGKRCTSAGSSTTCSTSPASRTGRSRCKRRRWTWPNSSAAASNRRPRASARPG